jgi:glycosyltransferase involved in cell wall biosynthesis
VPDVRPYLRRSAAVVVPLRIARGVQNKVLEALAMGKAVIASPQALVGLRARPGAEVLLAREPEEWAAAVHRLFADGDLRRRLGSAGRRYVEERHRWERCLEPLEPLLGRPEPIAAGQRPLPCVPAEG